MRGALVALAFAIAVAAAGCGDDGDGGLTTGDVSKQEYLAQADEICAQGDREISKDANQRFGSRQPSKEEITTFFEETVIPNVQGQLDDLRELEAPEADVEEIEKVYDTAQQNLDAFAANPGASAGKGADNPFEESNKLAQSYGFEDCGDG